MTVRLYGAVRLPHKQKKGRNSAENRLNYAFLFWVTFSQNETADF